MRYIPSAPVLILLGIFVFIVGAWLLFFNPHHTHADPLLGLSAFEKGEYYFNHDDDPAGPYDTQQAKQYYLKAIVEEPQNPYARYQLGRIYFIEGDFDAAIEQFNKQQELFNTEVPNVLYMLGLTYGFRARVLGQEEDWQKAEDAFFAFMEEAPTSPYPRVDLAWILFSQGKFEEMIEPLAEGLTYAPENPWLLNMYGLALFNTGKKEEARIQFLKAKEAASSLTVEDWGRTYPGNDPSLWGEGLEEFRSLIDKNVELTGAE